LRKTTTNRLTETTDLVHGHSVVSEKFSTFLRSSAGNSVRYEAVNAMLLNEFLKAHRRIEEQEATIARLQKQIDEVTAGLQTLSAQLEVAGPHRKPFWIISKAAGRRPTRRPITQQL
jgi:hypothetical protein